MTKIIEDGWVLGKMTPRGIVCNCGRGVATMDDLRLMHEECSIVPKHIADIDWSARFTAMSDEDFAALVVPAPSFQLDKGKDGSVTVVPV